jgi:hypothetical protein
MSAQSHVHKQIKLFCHADERKLIDNSTQITNQGFFSAAFAPEPPAENYTRSSKGC